MSFEMEPELLVPPPRAVRLARRTWLYPLRLWGVSLAILTIGGGLTMLFRTAPNEREALALKERGVVIEGRVTTIRKQPAGKNSSSRDLVDYEYFVDGKRYTGTESLDTLLRQTDNGPHLTAVGDVMTITYLPESPTVHRREKITDESVRQAEHGYSDIIYFVLGLTALVSASCVVIVLPVRIIELRRYLNLARYGIPVSAEVTTVDHLGICYRFDRAGQEVCGSATIKEILGVKLQTGSFTTVVYDPRVATRYALYREFDFLIGWIKNEGNRA